MQINKENIEAYLLDHIEGNLSREQEQELQVFLLLHPEYAESLESELPVLPADESSIDRSSLYKYSFASTDEALVGELEGTLSEDEKKELQHLIKNDPELEKERKLFALTVLEPVQINFPQKEQLKKRTGILITLHPRVLQMAALFLLALATATIIYFYSGTNSGKNQVADKAIPAGRNNSEHRSITPEEEVKAPSVTEQIASNNNTVTPIKKNSQGDRSNKVNNSLANMSGHKPSALEPVATITATIEVNSAEAKPTPAAVTYSSTIILREDQLATAQAKKEDEFLTVGQFAERLLSKVSKGKVGIIHNQRPDGSQTTELAVNAGQFQFSHKKNQ